MQVIGGFAKVPPLSAPGWIVSITSVHGRTWLVTVTSDDHHHVFRTGITDSIPWEFYIGRDGPCEGEYSIYDGDDPQQANLAKERKCRDH